MIAGIIAAGLGERLRDAGIGTPKPLVRVGGKTLLERAIGAAAEAGAERVAVIVNAESPEPARYVSERAWPVPVSLTVRTTPSSMESFFTLADDLRTAPFLLLTVDAIFPTAALRALAGRGLEAGPTGTLGVTTHVDDEKPLRVALDGDGRIVAIGGDAAASPWITSGVYFFHPDVYDRMGEARRRRLGALREFLGLVLASGARLHAFPMGKSIDVDRPEDIAAAERFLKEADAR